MRRHAAGFVIAALGAVLLVAFVSVSGTAQDTSPRLSFAIATGPSGGTYFPIGEAIASIVSHPPGADRCETEAACGPVGLIASARTSSGTVANVRDVNAGRADSGLAQADVVAEGIAGKGPFRALGAQSHIRSIASLFPEDVLIVAAKSSGIRTLADLKKKRVSLGAADSGTLATARAVLEAARLSHLVRSSEEPADVAAERLQEGKLDAFFFVGGAPVPFVQNLVSHGNVVLIPIDGAERTRLVAETRGLEPAVIPAGEYAGQARIETVATHATLIVNDAAPAEIVYGIVKALFNPANRQSLAASHPSAGAIRLETARVDLPAPLHPAAARFYAEAALARTEPGAHR
jgi:TRAP transporter TAXI family solute receptor